MAQGIVDGTPVDAATTNPVFLDANGDDATIGKLGLNNADLVSGTSITNTQREINNLAAQVGLTPNQALGATTTFTNSQGLTTPATVKARVEELSAKFHSSTGHSHDGSAGNGANIQAQSIAGVVLNGVAVAATNITSPSGSSVNVTSLMTAKTASSGSAAKGVVVTNPYNNVLLRQATGLSANDSLVDSLGNIVFGRITFSGSVWTLSFFVDLSGTETAYTLSGAQTTAGIKWFYQELFNPIVDAPVYSDLFYTPSESATADVIDATATQRGLVNTNIQSFSGQKTFTSGLITPDSTTQIVDATDATKKILFDAAGTTGTSTTLLSSQTTNKTLTMPDITDTLVTKNTTDILTNKSIDAATNTITNITNATVAAAAAIDASKIANGVVSNAEFQQLDGLTSPAVGTTQTQTLTNKTISGAANTIINVSLTTAVTGTLPISNGGTGQTTQQAAFDALSPIAAKGDLIVNNGTNDVALAVGTNAFVLTADSTAATGLKWAASSGANTTLSNLTSPTAINQDLISAADNTINIGTSSNYFANTYSKLITTNGNINPDAINFTTPRDIGNLFAFQRIRAGRFSPDLTTYSFTGDFTAGSTSVTNVVGTIPAWFASGTYSMFALGYTARFTGATASDGSVANINSFSGTTIVMSAQARATATGISFTVVPSYIARSENQTTTHSSPSTLSTGSTTTLESGHVALGSGTTTTGKSGEAIIFTGASSSGGSTGNILLTPGSTAGTKGKIRFANSNEGTVGYVWTSVDTSGGGQWSAAASASTTAPTVQRFTSGSGTYTRPTSPTPLYLKVRLIGGGGGGGGQGSNGSTGGTTTFGSSLLTGTGGSGGSTAGNGGLTGGSATASAPALPISLNTGAQGLAGSQLITSTGGGGGGSYFGGGGGGGQGNVGSGIAPTNTNSGTGGGGAGATASTPSCGGGAAGGFVEAIITSPSSTYSYAIGTGGAAGAASGSGAGGAGSAGVLIIEEFYQ